MKETRKQIDYLIFQKEYENLSGLKLPLQYLEESKVFTFKRNGKIVGGFIIGNKLPLRTLEIFVSKSNLEAISTFLDSPKLCEVCCFWIHRKYRRKLFFNACCWIKMTYAIMIQPKEFVLFGTNILGLAKTYGHPKRSVLIHKDLIERKHTYVFVAKRRDLVMGVSEIIMSKLLSKEMKITIQKNLKNKLIYELSK